MKPTTRSEHGSTRGTTRHNWGRRAGPSETGCAQAARDGARSPSPRSSTCSRPRGNDQFSTRVDHKMLWWPGHRLIDSVRVCSSASRRVAPLRPRFAGLTALTPAPRTLVQAGSCRRCPILTPYMLWSTNCAESGAFEWPLTLRGDPGPRLRRAGSGACSRAGCRKPRARTSSMPGPRVSTHGDNWPRRSTGPGSRRGPAAPTSTRWRRHERPTIAAGVYAATMDATILGWKMHQAEHADRAPATSCAKCPICSSRYAATRRCRLCERRDRPHRRRLPEPFSEPYSDYGGTRT